MSPEIRVISLKPIYAKRIIEGEKTIELRRRNIGLPYGATVLVYETAPTSAITGAFVAGKTFCLPPKSMWEKYHSSLGIGLQDFKDYLMGVSQVYGTHIAKTFPTAPIPLSRLTKQFPGFVPPQSSIKWKKQWETPEEWEAPLATSTHILRREGLLSSQLALFPDF